MGKVSKKIDSVKESIQNGIDNLVASDGSIDKSYLLKKVARVVFALLILYASHEAGTRINGLLKKHMLELQYKRLDDIEKEDGKDVTMAFRSRTNIAKFGGQIAYVVSLSIGFLVVLRVLGVEVATIVAMLSTLGFAVGFAVQGTLSDLAAGVLLAIFQSYEVGDIIKLNEFEGRVIDFQIISTLLQDIHTKTLMTLPNRIIQDSVVTNFSRSRYHVYPFEILVSNVHTLENDSGHQKPTAQIIDTIYNDLLSEKKYPSIYRKGDLKPSVSVGNINNPAGTEIRIKVHLSPDAIEGGRSEVRTGVRKLCDKEGIHLTSPF